MMRKLSILLIIFVGILAIYGAALANERNDGGYFNIVDESGNVVFMTGWKVRPGDQCLTADNRRFEVVSVNGDLAQAKLVGTVNLNEYAPKAQSGSILWGVLEPRIARAQGNGKIAIYHTHSDESYIPSDGSESITGNGGVYKVGDSFTSALQSKGMEVNHSMAKHDPHDDMAYERSRRTVTDLLKGQPDAIFDVHRDALPPEAYKTTINGQDVTKVQLVVGKYGPTGKQAEDYALQLKSACDQQHPGLVKGIFFAKGGDYNQDLHPRSMLLEVGAHTNSREEAERGIALFSDIMPTILGRTGATSQNPAGATGVGTAASGASGASKSIGWILGLLVVGGAAFLFLSTGSMKEAGSKLKQFGTSEFANFLGPKLKRVKERLSKKDGRKNE